MQGSCVGKGGALGGVLLDGAAGRGAHRRVSIGGIIVFGHNVARALGQSRNGDALAVGQGEGIPAADGAVRHAAAGVGIGHIGRAGQCQGEFKNLPVVTGVAGHGLGNIQTAHGAGVGEDGALGGILGNGAAGPGAGCGISVGGIIRFCYGVARPLGQAGDGDALAVGQGNGISVANRTVGYAAAGIGVGNVGRAGQRERKVKRFRGIACVAGHRLTDGQVSHGPGIGKGRGLCGVGHDGAGLAAAGGGVAIVGIYRLSHRVCGVLRQPHNGDALAVGQGYGVPAFDGTAGHAVADVGVGTGCAAQRYGKVKPLASVGAVTGHGLGDGQITGRTRYKVRNGDSIGLPVYGRGDG